VAAAAHVHLHSEDTVLRIPLFIGTVVIAALAGAAPALASSVAITAPATAATDSLINVVYSGSADAPGTSDVTGTGENMSLRTFFEPGASSCGSTSAEEKARPKAQFDGNQFIISPAPYTLTSTATFTTPAIYRICAYLEIGLNGDVVPPVAFAEAVMNVGNAPIPCTVPKVTGLTLATAKKRLTTAGCALGKVKKPKKTGKKVLIVRSQDPTETVVFEHGRKINLVLKVKPKKK
jgi:hypothetical protein